MIPFQEVIVKKKSPFLNQLIHLQGRSALARERVVNVIFKIV